MINEERVTRIFTVGILAAILGVLLFIGYLGVRPVAEIPEARGDYGTLKTEAVTLSGTGTAGAVSISASTTAPLRGHLYAVQLNWTAGISATTDITITQDSPALNVLILTDTVTDAWYYPGAQLTANGAGIAGAYDHLLVNDALDIAVTYTSSGTVGTATFYWGP